MVRSLAFLVAISVVMAACGSNKSGNAERKGRPQPFERAQYPNVDGTVFGMWQAPQKSSGDVTYNHQLFINKSSIGITFFCSRDKEAVGSSFSLPARVTETTVEILDTVSVVVNLNNIECTGTLVAGVYTYSVAFDHLRMSRPGEPDLDLTRLLQ